MAVAVPVIVCASLLLGSTSSPAQLTAAETLNKPVTVPTSQIVHPSLSGTWYMPVHQHLPAKSKPVPVKPVKPPVKHTVPDKPVPTFTPKKTVTPAPTKTASITQDASFNEKVIKFAESQMGIPYVYGGETPGVSFDCSGLVQWAYEEAGHWVPRVTQDQFNFFRMIPKSEARPGDLVFFHTTYDPASYVYHVGIYLGGNDMMVVAPAPGTDVQVQNFDWGGNTITFGTLDIR